MGAAAPSRDNMDPPGGGNTTIKTSERSDVVEAGGVERLDSGGSLRQLFLRREDEVQAPEAHVARPRPSLRRD